VARLTEQMEQLSQALAMAATVAANTPIAPTPTLADGDRTREAEPKERQIVTQLTPIETFVAADEDIEDEPDEILYEFLPPRQE